MDEKQQAEVSRTDAVQTPDAPQTDGQRDSNAMFEKTVGQTRYRVTLYFAQDGAADLETRMKRVVMHDMMNQGFELPEETA